MKKSNLLLALFIGLVFVIGCKPKGPAEPSEKEKQTTLLSQSWTVKTAANSVTLDGTDVTTDWTGFSLTILSDGTYTATSVASGREVVWPTPGTWQFQSDTELNTLVRGDGVVITIVVDESTLQLKFTYTTPGGRTNGTDGAWIFNMAKN